MNCLLSLDINEIVKCVKTINDYNLCNICDKSNVTLMRYPCGHTSCKDCVNVTEDCSSCLTPPVACAKPILDEPYTHRAKNSLALLNAFQDAFHVNVYRSQRISDQLKAEKLLFPKCIQAPIKYTNKNKEFKYSDNIKENSPYFLREDTFKTSKTKMENTVNYVQQWLAQNDQNVERKPLADLSSNNKNLYPHNARNMEKFDSESKNIIRANGNKSSNILSRKRKKKISSQTISHIQSELHKCSEQPFHNTKRTKFQETIKENSPTSKVVGDIDESGIVIDDDIIFIDDSQSVTIDKDSLAWQAVLQADKKDPDCSKMADTTYMSTTSTHSIVFDNKNHNIQVPFYKKSKLFEIYKSCKCACKIPSNTRVNDNNVSITVENNSFVTTIKVFENVENSDKPLACHNISVQTDISDVEQLGALNSEQELQLSNQNISQRNNIVNQESRVNQICSPSLLGTTYDFEKNREIFQPICSDVIDRPINKKINTVVEESDSDYDVQEGTSIQVIAEVTRSCSPSDYDVLTEVKNFKEHGNRSRRAPRGNTPNSTDSSEKENFNPNRLSKSKRGKKGSTKKK